MDPAVAQILHRVADSFQRVGAGAELDLAPGGLFADDEPVVAESLSGREPGVALDAACGSGRFADFLARRPARH